jgi:hypothetical protein
MCEAKMKENDNSVIEFIESVEDGKKKADARKLMEIFEETTGFPAKMWGSGIIGFGKYHYKYASGHEGDAPLAGFSPRKGENHIEVLTALIKRTEETYQKLYPNG